MKSPEQKSSRGGGGKWLLLALAFLAVNSYAVWKLTHKPAQRVAAESPATFHVVSFSKTENAVVENREPLKWIFSHDVVTADEIGKKQTHGPMFFRPALSGSFVWKSARELEFVPSHPWPLCQMFDARIDDNLVAARGAKFDGPRSWHFRSESMKLVDLKQIDCSADRCLALRLVFNAVPDRDILRKKLSFTQTDENENEQNIWYEFLGEGGASNAVIIQTASVSADKIKLHLEDGLLAKDGPLGSSGKAECEISVETKFTLKAIESECPAFEQATITLSFSTQPDVADAASFIEIEPHVKFTVRAEEGWRGANLKIFGDFKSGGIYSLKIRSGLRAVNGERLPKDIERAIEFPDRPASLAIATSGHYLSPRGRLAVSVEAVNLRECSISVTPVMANNLVSLSQRSAWQIDRDDGLDDLTGNTVVHTNKLANKQNEVSKLRVDLRDFANDPRGVYLLAVRGEDKSGEADRWDRVKHDSQLIVVTDLGILARCSKTNLLVWINSLRDAKPVANAAVTIFARNNQIIADGKTDASGLISLPCDVAQKMKTPFIVTAKLENDLSYLKLDDSAVALNGETGGREYLADGCEAFIFSDRGIYRPGETLHAQAIVRNSRLVAPVAFPAIFRITKPDGRVFKDLPVKLDDFGAAEISTPLPDYLPTGRYSVELAMPGTFKQIGETIVSLEDFVPPQIRVKLETPQDRIKAGEEVTLRISAEHLFGAAAAGLRADVSTTLKSAPFAPKAWKEFHFGDDEKKLSSQYKRLGAAKLDENGKVGLKLETSAELRPSAALQLVAQATVFESSGRPVTAFSSSFIDVYPFYIGVKTPFGGTIHVGETQRVSIVEILPDGAAAKEFKPLHVRLSSVQWNTVMRRNNRGHYEYVSQRQLTTVREDTAQNEFAFSVANSGEYLLTFSDPASESSTSVRFYASAPDQQWVEWSREKPDVVSLKLDRNEYKPGGKARLMIQAPFTGQALLTVESDHVIESRLLTLEKNTAETEIEVRPEFSPNVYCSVTLIRPAVAESVWTAHRAAGVVPLKVIPPGRKLEVAIDAPATNRPQSKLIAKLHLRDEKGAPADGDVTVMAVDEAICMLTAFESPDPFKWFLEQRRLGVDLRDLYSELMPVIDDFAAETKSHIGGDEGSALRRRLNPIKANRFKPVSLWSSEVHTTNGEADVSFDVPEFTGELRLMAVACNKSQTGSAHESVKVKRPLVVQPSLPRFLAPGDSCAMNVEIFNESSSTVPVNLRVTCEGPLSAGKPETTATVLAGKSQSLEIPVKAVAFYGKALCTVECEGGAEKYRETIELAVRPIAAADITAEFGTLKAGSKREISAPANWIPETVRREIWVSSQPGLKLGRSLDYLLNYPYGCVEQTVSASLPLLYLSDLANRALPKAMGREETSHFVQAGILRVLSMQQADGSFAMWQYQRGTWSWGTIYAAHFLVEAKKAAYDVPSDRLDAALKWLRERLDKKVSDGEEDAEERAYCCYVLALAGQPEHGWNSRLADMAPKLSFCARTLNASALMLAGEPRRAVDLLKGLGLPIAHEREIGGSLNSTTRDAALLLSAWLDIDPKNESVARLVQQLDKQQKHGHWGSTQDDAMALLALGKYAQRVPRDAAPFIGLLALSGGLNRPFGSTQDVHWVSTPEQTGAVTLVNDGPGSLFYSLRAEGVPADGTVVEADNGIAVRREWLDIASNAVDIASVKQGDLVIVKIVVDPKGRGLDNIAIEDLLPAGLEVENANLATAQIVPWLKEKSDWCVHRDIRDDRVVLFTGPLTARSVFYYAARAVTPGHYVVPPITAECMYDPEIRSVNGRAAMEVRQ